MSTFKYEIVNFDPVNLRLEINMFEDGWARIQLTSPLPKTVDELEAIIRQFAPAKEVAAAKQETETTDMSFVTALVGVTRETDRIVLIPTEAPPATGNSTADGIAAPALDGVSDAELAFFREQVEAVLKDHKLI